MGHQGSEIYNSAYHKLQSKERLTLAEAFALLDFERAIDKDNDGLVVVDKPALETVLDFLRGHELTAVGPRTAKAYRRPDNV